MVLRPLSISGRLLLLIIVVVAVPVLASGFLISVHLEEALSEEKTSKLFGAARLLDAAMPESYQAVLAQHGASEADRETKIRVLNEFLHDRTERVAAAYPGIGVGYYSKELDAILSYGPAVEMGSSVGKPIAAAHRGREVMASGREIVQKGSLVRGNVMNAMHPVIRNGEVIGYIWANELMANIDLQLLVLRRNIYLALFIGVMVGLLGVTEVVDKYMDVIRSIKRGILSLQQDPNFRLAPIKDDMAPIVTAVNQMADELAARREAESRAHHAERLAVVGEIAAGMAHEIRNPLMSIRGFAQLLQEELAPNGAQQQYLSIIVKETQRMNDLIERLLHYARPPGGRDDLVNVNTVLLDTLQLTASRVRRKNIFLAHQLGDELPCVYADQEQLKQVVLNLLINAIQALENRPGEGQVLATTTYDAELERVKISVSDNGDGIADEMIDKIFMPFFTTKEQGTGLGLAMVEKTVTNMGGAVQVTSNRGEGACFTLLLPPAKGDAC